MLRLPHPHKRRFSLVAFTLAALLLVSGCSTAQEEDSAALRELEPLVIETSASDGTAGTADRADAGEEDQLPSARYSTEAASSPTPTEKLIIRRATERLALKFDAQEFGGFGAVDMDLLEAAANSDVGYLVHGGALAIKSGREEISLRQRFDPSTEGSPRVEFTADIPQADDESWLSYKIYFERGFEWSKGGKLPGLAGGTHPTFDGGDGTDGFSARLAWMPDGQMGVYLYHPDRPDELGELRGTFGTFEKQKWHEITQRVVMNSRGQSDGILEVWLDDLLVFTDSEMTWRTTGDFGADVFLYSAFYGGGSRDWAPTKTTYTRIADITVSTTETDLQGTAQR